MPSTEVRDLHVANSISELQDKSEVDVSKKNLTAIQLSKSAVKLFEHAEKSRLYGDEENAYIYYVRYLTLVSSLKRTSDYAIKKSDVLKHVSQKDIENALSYATNLKGSLEKRYDCKRRLDKLNDYEKQNIVKQKIETDREKARRNLEHNALKNFTFPEEEDKNIVVRQLYKVLQDKGNKIMVLDTRSQEDYKMSHMKHHLCINIPEESIKQGYTPDRVVRGLPHDTINVWNKRKDMDLLVLLDWTSSTAQPGTKLEIFYTGLQKWDVEVKYKRKPIVLDGGYEAWLLAYPTMTTNPNVTPPHPNSEFDDLLNDIEYPSSLFDTPIDKKPSSVSNGLPALKPQVNRDVKNSTTVFNNNPVVNRSENTASNNNPMIDRSKKAAALEVYENKAKEMKALMEKKEKLANDSFTIEKERIKAEENWEEIYISHEKEVEEGKKENLQLKKDELQSLLLHLENKQMDTTAEIENLKQCLAQLNASESGEATTDPNVPSAALENSITQEIVDVIVESPEVNEEAKRAVEEAIEQERKIREINEEKAELALKREVMQIEREKKLAEARALKKLKYKQIEESENETVPLKTDESNTGFNRSHSTPNIAQLDDEMPVKPKIPHFDRNIKPSYKTPSDYNQARQRDFQGVLGCPGRGLTGLKNLGNTCYMNSIMQCLSNTADLAEYFRADRYRNDVRGAQISTKNNSGTRGAVAEEVAAVVKALWSGQFRFISAKDLRNVVGKHQVMFRGFEQQDSHEFLTILMDWLHNDLQTPTRALNQVDTLPAAEKAWLEYTKSKESLILNLFYGQIKSTLTCLTCSNKSITHDSFSNLSLELPAHSNRCSLSDCLQLYLQDEKISDWNCPSCKQKRDAVKKLDISRLPPILVIHFKRFYLDPKDYMANSYKKKLTNIDFPLFDLNMGKFSTESYRSRKCMTYNLYGVSNHYGSMEGGHYTAYCKSSVYSKWYKFDDHVVTEISPSDVKSSAAYILFYSSLPEN